MFLLISIPMADRRLAKREGFDAYRAETRALLPIPRRGAGYTPEIVIEEKKVRHGAKRKKKRKK
jgi:hypothetical protein